MGDGMRRRPYVRVLRSAVLSVRQRPRPRNGLRTLALHARYAGVHSSGSGVHHAYGPASGKQ